MIIKDLIVTGLCKILRNVTIQNLVTEAINEVTKDEISNLKGLTENVQTQIGNINSSITEAQREQENWKSQISEAINNIPRNPNGELSPTASLDGFINEIGEIEHGPDVSKVTAIASKVIEGYTFIDKDWNTVVGILDDLGLYPTPTRMEIANYGKSGVSKLYMYINDSIYGSEHDARIHGGITIPAIELGDADTIDVLEGKTFTSRAGIKKTGAIPISPCKTSDWVTNYAYNNYQINWPTTYDEQRDINGQAYKIFLVYQPMVESRSEFTLKTLRNNFK